MAPATQHQHDSMVKGANAVEEGHNTIVGLQGQLRQHHEDLVGQGWKGQAAIAFTGAYADFDSKFTTIIRDLADIVEKLQQVGATYDATEVEQKANASRVMGLLNGSQT